MEDALPDLDFDAVLDALGSRDWPRVEEVLKEAGYDLEDLGALAVQARDDADDAG